MNKIKIYVGTTWIRFRCNRNGVLENGTSIAHFIQDRLRQREWNPKLNCYVSSYNFTHYDSSSLEAIMPRYILDAFLEYIGKDAAEIIPVEPVNVTDHFNPKKIKIKDKFTPRENQVPMIEFMSDPNRDYAPMNASTGVGKTACSMWSMLNVGGPVLIVLGLLLEQWFKAIKEYTTIPRADIYVIQGFDSVKTLWEMLDNGFKPKVVLVSTRTLYLYAVDGKAPYDSVPSYKNLQERIGFATKIIDECHLNFYANVQIDLQSNIKKNIYLSATYMRSDRIGRMIFDSVYPPELRYGEKEIKKYTTVITAQYTLSLYETVVNKFKRDRGYMHALFEKYLLKHRSFYFETWLREILLPLIKMYYRNIRKDKQRLLILCKTREFVEEVAKELKSSLSGYKVSVYFSGDPGKFGKQENLQSDVVVSTISSCGTGVDIKGLKTCINTVSFASAPLAAQAMGRLRQIPGEDTFFVDLWCSDVPTHRHHLRSRMDIYRTKALKIVETQIR